MIFSDKFYILTTMKICCFQCKDKAHGYNLDWVSFLWNRWLTLVHFLSNRNLCFSCPMDIYVLLSNGKLCFYLTNGYLCIILLSNGNLFLLTNGNLCDSRRMETFIFSCPMKSLFFLSPPPIGPDSAPLCCCFNVADPPRPQTCVSFFDQRVFFHQIC